MIVSILQFPKEKILSLQKKLPLPVKASTLLSTKKHPRFRRTGGVCCHIVQKLTCGGS